MRAHVIENGIVTNTIEVERFDFMPGLIDASLGGAIGWLWDGEKFSEPPAPPVPVPEVVTIRQARMALLNAGLIDGVIAAISTMSRSAQIDWEYATEVRRDWPTLLEAQRAIGLTDDQVDDLFKTAAAL